METSNETASLSPCVKIGSSLLYASDKNVIEDPKGWLTDEIMYCAQQLLKNKYPHISGLQCSSLQLTRTFDVHASKEFIQCLNLGGSHWITLSSIGCEPATVRVYDSMNLRLSSTLIKLPYSTQFKRHKIIISGWSGA